MDNLIPQYQLVSTILESGELVWETDFIGNTQRLQNLYLNSRLSDILEDSFCESIAVVLFNSHQC